MKVVRIVNNAQSIHVMGDRLGVLPFEFFPAEASDTLPWCSMSSCRSSNCFR
jgi:hypothetical protein